MGIPVTCPHGHHFSVKDKYAGKKGICPYCEGQVVVRVPDALSSQDLQEGVTRAVRDERKGTHAVAERLVGARRHARGKGPPAPAAAAS